MTEFGDDEDSASSEGLSLNDSYVEAPLENMQVGSCDPPSLLRRITIALGYTCTFSNGRGAGSNRRSSELFSRK